jgi:hypothetical protein
MREEEKVWRVELRIEYALLVLDDEGTGTGTSAVETLRDALDVGAEAEVLGTGITTGISVV